jgi:NAD(P)-dependent dehydrogenase (short-subunit alcohol dehydrogenase family)
MMADALSGDLSSEESVLHIHRKVARASNFHFLTIFKATLFLEGPIDTLICNAGTRSRQFGLYLISPSSGIGRWNNIENVSTRDFDEMISVNVKGNVNQNSPVLLTLTVIT